MTSLSFDISVLELLWTLARGLRVVLQSADAATVAAAPAAVRRTEFSLFYFADESHGDEPRYHLLLEGARYADTHGFSAVWIDWVKRKLVSTRK